MISYVIFSSSLRLSEAARKLEESRKRRAAMQQAKGVEKKPEKEPHITIGVGASSIIFYIYISYICIYNIYKNIYHCNRLVSHRGQYV